MGAPPGVADDAGGGGRGGASLRESGFGARGGLFSILTLFFC